MEIVLTKSRLVDTPIITRMDEAYKINVVDDVVTGVAHFDGVWKDLDLDSDESSEATITDEQIQFILEAGLAGTSAAESDSTSELDYGTTENPNDADTVEYKAWQGGYDYVWNQLHD